MGSLAEAGFLAGERRVLTDLDGVALLGARGEEESACDAEGGEERFHRKVESAKSGIDTRDEVEFSVAHLEHHR